MSKLQTENENCCLAILSIEAGQSATEARAMINFGSAQRSDRT